MQWDSLIKKYELLKINDVSVNEIFLILGLYLFMYWILSKSAWVEILAARINGLLWMKIS